MAMVAWMADGPIRLFTALSILFILTSWGYTNKLFRSEMLSRYKEQELGL